MTLQEKSTGVRSGDLGGYSMTSLLSLKKCLYKTWRTKTKSK